MVARCRIGWDMSSTDLPASVTATDPEEVLQPIRFGFDNTYVRLPDRFFARLDPTPVAAPSLIKVNETLARELDLDPRALASEEGLQILAGNRVGDGSQPLAMAYAGHQFGYFVPQLGDRRAILLGEVLGRNGRRYDIQLKGSGPTPYSRRGDGRAALGPVLREYLVSEAMAAMGIPSTRALAAVATGEQVLREGWLPGAVLTRVAASHLRVGTFQFFAARGDTEGVRRLADYAIDRHYPEILRTEPGPKAKPYGVLLKSVIGRHARLVAQWMLVGFIHGVMNTDNTSISGETIDYGPCAFMEAYDPGKVFSSIDRMGRYSYENQPLAAEWNLTRLAEALLPLLEEEEGGKEAAVLSAQEALSTFMPQFEQARSSGLRQKLGLFSEKQGDVELAEQLLKRMAANGADLTLTFRRLCDAAVGADADESISELFADPFAYRSWAERWRQRLAEDPASNETRIVAMRQVNPAFIPRNHLVEAAIRAAVAEGNLRPFEDLLDVVSRPYEDRPGLVRYTTPARPEECMNQTFCGT